MKRSAQTSSKAVKMHHTLFLKTYLGFSAIILLFAIFFGVVYMRLYEKTTMESFRDQLQSKSKNIAARCSRYFLDKDPQGWAEYSLMLGEIERIEAWTVSNPNAVTPLSSEFAITPETFQKLGQYDSFYGDILNNGFHSYSQARLSYSAAHQANIISVGAPVLGLNGEVAGCILLNAAVESEREIVSNSWRLIAVSALIALVVAFLAAFLYVKTLSTPILRVRKTALRLADGDYEVETKVRRRDEIGELAQTVDFLSQKLKENEIERKNLDQMRFDFFANVSHELRTPITVMRAYTESLVDGVVEDPDKIAHYYERMLNECKGMERLVGDLLLLSKMQNPDFNVDKQPVNLVDIFENLRKTAMTLGDEKNIAIEFTHADPVVMMLGDYDRLRQMFLVIVDNAVKFSPENSTVYIKIEQEKEIRVSVRDEGIGISREEQEFIFEKFYRSKLRQNAKGSGLGLAIAKQIAIKHDGSIAVNSEVGKGTEIVFTFPKAEQQHETEKR